MAAKIFRINYKSDFILTLNSDAGWMTPFCIKFWTSVPSLAYFVGFDGTTYTHCAYDPSEPTKLVVQFDDHHLPIGDLNYQIAYYFTVDDFPNDTEDEVINPATITTEIDGETYHVMLDFTGETAPEIQFSLPAYANEAQRIANEEQRIADEQTRISNEQTRQQNEAQRIEQEAERVAQYDADHQQAVADHDQYVIDNAQLTGLVERADADHNTAVADHTQAGNDHTQAGNDHTQAGNDHTRAESDHTRAESDHTRAESDHTTAASDHSLAEGDHTTAASDHSRAESDHTRAESDHAAVEVYVDSLGAFDISSYHATGDVLAKYADLTAALGTNGANIPDALRKGGMSVKFVHSSDNKYIQARCMAQNFTTDTTQWQGVDDEPTAGSNNLVKSGGIKASVDNISSYLASNNEDTDEPTREDGYYMKKTSTGGVVREANNYCLVRPVALNPGDVFIVNQGKSTYIASDGILLYETDSEGNFVRSIIDRVSDPSGYVVNASFKNNTNSTVYVGTSTYITPKQYGYSIKKHEKAVGVTEFSNSCSDITKNLIIGWINAEAFTVVTATYTNGVIDSPVGVVWPDGITGDLTITRVNGSVTKIVATHGDDSYDYYITRNSDGYVTSTYIIKN